MNIFEKDAEYIADTYARFPLQIASGKGSIAVDNEGKEYIDLGAGIAVNTFGYSDEEWCAAVEGQLKKLSHTSNLYYTSPCAELAEQLCLKTGLKKVFFSNSGAEANECAIKLARKYAQDKKGEEYSTIITLKNSFHGRTITTLAANGQDVFHRYFQPLTEGFVYSEPNKESITELTSNNKVAAIMFELVQGEGGVLPLEKSFVLWLEEFAKENDILLIDDEVQTGNGRSGFLYAYMYYGISPDIVSTAKGLAGGLPLGATIMGEKAEKVFTKGLHGSTFGANPICCAGALNILSRIDDNLLSEVQKKAELVRRELSGADGVLSVTGLGLMIGIETKKAAKDIALECLKKGVLVLTAKNKVRLLPALNIPDELLIKGLSVLKQVCNGGENIC